MPDIAIPRSSGPHDLNQIAITELADLIGALESGRLVLVDYTYEAEVDPGSGRATKRKTVTITTWPAT